MEFLVIVGNGGQIVDHLTRNRFIRLDNICSSVQLMLSAAYGVIDNVKVDNGCRLLTGRIGGSRPTI